MPRNKSGFLKADALRNGIPDQVAFDKHGMRHVVEILYDTREYGGFATVHRTVSLADAESWDERVAQYGDDLPAARTEFKRIVKAIRG